eukprot:6027285-Amphidinium_carterae.6
MTTREKWSVALAQRVRTAGALTEKEKEEYIKVTLRDRAQARRKIFFPENKSKHYTEQNEKDEVSKMPAEPSDLAPNDSGLPAPDYSHKAKMAEQWCKQGSWQMCQNCRSMRPRPFRPGDLHRAAAPTVKTCSVCRSGGKVAQPRDVPEPLCNLNKKIIEALRPLDVFTGKYV